jgi:hypothetical protein
VRLFSFIVTAGLAAPAGAEALAQAAAGGAECRESTFRTADGRTTAVKYCRDADGSWRKVAGAELPRPPFPYRSEVSFRGTYQLTVTRPGRPMRRVDIASLIKSAGESQKLEGAIAFAARFDGPAAYAQVSGTGGLDTLQLSGLVRGGHCRLVDQRQWIVYEGKCDQSGFKGTLKSTSAARVKVSGTFETGVASITDLDRP